MAVHSLAVKSTCRERALNPVRIAAFPEMQALAWSGAVLYASRGYTLLRARIRASESPAWEIIGAYRPGMWRGISLSSRLVSRLFRDGFHALAVLASGHLIAAVPHAIVTLSPGETEFGITHKVVRGTRPLHIATTPDDHIFWGEYFNNPRRDEVHIYASTDRGSHWDIAYTFPTGKIRHVHNIVYDKWENCFWVLTGDEGSECRILRASCDFRNVDVILSGSQQTRAAALAPTEDALYFASDTPFERNHVYRLDRRGNLRRVAALNGPSIYGCSIGNSIFFSTMVEPNSVNSDRSVCLYGSADGDTWHRIVQHPKDRWPMRMFQYGNAFLPDGINTSGFLAVTTIATERCDLETTIWRI
jgi:hypothetical protein